MDMCIDMRIDMRIDRHVYRHLYRHARRHACSNVYVGMCTDTCIENVHIDMCIGVQLLVLAAW